jgi:hypothetical protein
LLIERNELAVFHSGREADENDCCRACRSHHDGHHLDVVLDDPEMPEQRLGHTWLLGHSSLRFRR